MDVLGPMAEQIKERLAKEANKAVSNQDNTTDKLENTYSKSRQLANKQQTLYQQQLQRRGYVIDQTGKEVKTERKLSISQQSLLEKLDKAIAKEAALVQATDKPVQQFKALAESVNSIGGIFDKLQDKMFEMTGKSVGGAIALQTSIAALTGVTKAFGAMAEAIYQGERGASVGAKGTKEFSEAMTKAAYGIGAALLILPLGPALKIVGVALAAAAAAMEGATKLIEMGADLNDKLYKSYGSLSEKGLTTAKGMSGLYDSLHKVGLSAGEIDKFNKLLGDNSKELSLFGGIAAKGVSKFEKVASAIAAPTSALNKQFLLMGINSDAQREHIMKYMTEEDRLGLAKGRSDEQQVVGAKKYIENLDKLSMLTGANRKELEEARAGVMANENLRAAIFEAEQDKSEAGKARLAELKRAYEASAMLAAAGDVKGSQGVAEYFAGRGITSSLSATAYNQFTGKGGLIEGIKKGADTAELTARAAKGYQRQADIMSTTGRFGGDTSGMMTAGFGQAQEFIRRSAEVQAEAAKQGLSVSDYLEKQQEARKNTKDVTTQKNAEVAQLQQQTAMTIDGAAKKMLDTSDLVMGPAMKLLKESTDLFGSAVKKIAKEKGIEVADPLAVAVEKTSKLKKDVDILKESIRIKNKSIQNLDPTVEANKAYIAKLKVELAEKNKDLTKTEQDLIVATIEEKKLKEAGPAGLPPSATIPTPPGPPAKGAGAPSTRSLSGGEPLIYGSQSGSKSNFDALAVGFKERILAAAQAFNAATGNKIKINSAKRDSEDQQRLWDESVKAGRPGISPSGMPIGKPGRSKHERGLAVDIQNYQDKNAVAAMNKQGLFQTVPNDPVHFEMANTGAMFSGPSEGYFVQLHGKEFVGNENQIDAIKKLLDKVDEIGLLSETTTEETAETSIVDDDSSVIIEKFTAMLESKADELLEKIKFGNRVDTDLLNYSQG